MIEIETNIPTHGEKHQSDVVLEFLLAKIAKIGEKNLLANKRLTQDSQNTDITHTLDLHINNNINSQHYEGLQIPDRNSHPLQEGN